MLARMLQACRSTAHSQCRGRLLVRACGRLRPLDAAARQQLSCLALQQPQARPEPAAAAASLHWRRPLHTARHSRQAAAAAAKGKAEAEAAAEETSDSESDEESGEELGEVVEGEEEGWEELEEDLAPQLSAGGVDWGERALAVAQGLLGGGHPELRDIQLFSFRAIPSAKRLDIRLDKTTDPFGSPSLDDVAVFSRLFNAAFEAAAGEAASGDVEVEVSSPGAERQVRVPAELPRFAALPMKVEYALEEDKVETKVLAFSELDAAAGVTRWKLADVRANRQSGGKGRGLNRKQRDAVYELPLAVLRRVNLHVDF